MKLIVIAHLDRQKTLTIALFCNSIHYIVLHSNGWQSSKKCVCANIVAFGNFAKLCFIETGREGEDSYRRLSAIHPLQMKSLSVERFAGIVPARDRINLQALLLLLQIEGRRGESGAPCILQIGHSGGWPRRAAIHSAGPLTRSA